MNLVRFQRPVDAFNVNSLFNDVFSGSNQSVPRYLNSIQPSVNVKESDEGYHLDLVAPGYNKENFSVINTEGKLLIKAELEDKKKDDDYSRLEYSVVNFERVFKLPKNADADNISAKYVNGILNVMIPKKQEEEKSENVSIPVL